jgi:hypothetical protein
MDQKQQHMVTVHPLDEATEPDELTPPPPGPGWDLKSVQIDKEKKTLRAIWVKRPPLDLSVAGARSERSDLGPPRGRF